MKKKTIDKQRNEIFRSQKQNLKDVSRAGKIQSSSQNNQKRNTHQIKSEKKLFEFKKAEIFNKFSAFITIGDGAILLDVPINFSFCEEYSKSMLFIKEFASSIYDYPGYEITLNFKKCKKADSAALFVLQIIRMELVEKLEKFQKQLTYTEIIPKIKVINSLSLDVLRLMRSNGYPINKTNISEIENDSNLVPLHSMGYYKGMGSQKHYLENKKTIYGNKVINYLNECFSSLGYEFTETYKNRLHGIIGEVLGNAEDHSNEGTWFISGNFSEEKSNDINEENVSELNLTILNFGESFYEGFYNKRQKNHEQFDLINEKVKKLLSLDLKSRLEEEQLFTLWMMSDGITRLKYKEPSRGTGTMSFINSFVDLAEYVNIKKGFIPNLSLFTGSTQLICDNDNKPFVKGTVNCLSLNSENDLTKLPRESHLKKLNTHFPGTLLSIKIYLNKNHLNQKYGGENNEQ